MKKVLSLILALAMVFALVACGEKQPASDGDVSSDGDKSARGNVIMTFGTADTGGSMFPAGAAVSQVWTNNVQGVKCNTQTSTGSFQNCQDVSTGEVDVAVATSDVVLNAYNGTRKYAAIGKLDNLRVIGAVYTSVLSGVALKSSGLTYIHELLGKRVAVGPAASATENATLAAFGVMGIDSSNTSLENLGLGDGAAAGGAGRRGPAVRVARRRHRRPGAPAGSPPSPLWTSLRTTPALRTSASATAPTPSATASSTRPSASPACPSAVS